MKDIKPTPELLIAAGFTEYNTSGFEIIVEKGKKLNVVLITPVIFISSGNTRDIRESYCNIPFTLEWINFAYRVLGGTKDLDFTLPEIKPELSLESLKDEIEELRVIVQGKNRVEDEELPIEFGCWAVLLERINDIGPKGTIVLVYSNINNDGDFKCATSENWNSWNFVAECNLKRINKPLK